MTLQTSAPLGGIAISNMSIAPSKVWVSFATGTDGTTEALHLSSLALASTPHYPTSHASNSVTSRVDGRVLLVTDPGQDDTALDFCASPTSGAYRNQLPARDQSTLAATPSTLYLGGQSDGPSKVALSTAAVPASCK